jgi:hypothetical protein
MNKIIYNWNGRDGGKRHIIVGMGHHHGGGEGPLRITEPKITSVITLAEEQVMKLLTSNFLRDYVISLLLGTNIAIHKKHSQPMSFPQHESPHLTPIQFFVFSLSELL